MHNKYIPILSTKKNHSTTQQFAAVGAYSLKIACGWMWMIACKYLDSLGTSYSSSIIRQQKNIQSEFAMEIKVISAAAVAHLSCLNCLFFTWQMILVKKVFFDLSKGMWKLPLMEILSGPLIYQIMAYQIKVLQVALNDCQVSLAQPHSNGQVNN